MAGSRFGGDGDGRLGASGVRDPPDYGIEARALHSELSVGPLKFASRASTAATSPTAFARLATLLTFNPRGSGGATMLRNPAALVRPFVMFHTFAARVPQFRLSA
jgi:hypothetical protein